VNVSVGRDIILTFMVRIMRDGAIKTDWTVVEGGWGEIIGEITTRNLRVAMKCVPKDILLAMRISAPPATQAAIANKAGPTLVPATGEGANEAASAPAINVEQPGASADKPAAQTSPAAKPVAGESVAAGEGVPSGNVPGTQTPRPDESVSYSSGRLLITFLAQSLSPLYN
jgi:hypothetical protein